MRLNTVGDTMMYGMEATKTISLNSKARHDYNIEDSIEAGLVLMGTEIKSIRAGRVSLSDAYAKPEGDELWLIGAHIAQYANASHSNHEPKRPRKLLLHRKEIDGLIAKRDAKGLTLIPLRLYLKNGLAKVELGIARGKKLYDKRRSIAEREGAREVGRAMKKRQR